MINNIASRLTVTLKTEMSASDIFPFSDRKKFPTKQFKPHMKNIAFNNNPIVVVSPTVQYFELGNDYAEKVAPYYHILEDAKVIRNPFRGSKQTRGSQAGVFPLSKRDYSVGSLNRDNIVSPEYRGSFTAGKRSYWNAQRRLVNRRFETGGQTSKFRYNIHYAYIERILEKELPKIASLSGLRLLTSSKGLNLPERGGGEIMADVESLFGLGLGE